MTRGGAGKLEISSPPHTRGVQTEPTHMGGLLGSSREKQMRVELAGLQRVGFGSPGPPVPLTLKLAPN